MSDVSGPEEWQCYHCISVKISTSGLDENTGIKEITTSLIGDHQEKQSDQWKETVEEITNQRIVKAQTYLKRLRNHQRHLNLENSDQIINNWGDSSDNTSIFNNNDFPLKLSPAVKSDIS